MNSTRSTSPKYCCANYASDLMMVFGINLATDTPASHPVSFCYLCHQVVTAYKNALAHGRTYKVCTVMFDGSESHGNDRCCVCKHGKSKEKGGRPRKCKLIVRPGRPLEVSLRRLVKHIELTAPPPFMPSMLHPPTIAGNVSRLSAECPLCLEVLSSPIELVTCGAIVCSNCCCTWLNLRHELLCPCCYGDHLRDITTVRAPCNLVLDALKCIPVICSKCKNEILLSDYATDLGSGCAFVPVNSIVSEILSHPVNQPLSPIESQLQTNVKRSLLSSPTKGVVVLKTHGKVVKLHVHYRS